MNPCFVSLNLIFNLWVDISHQLTAWFFSQTVLFETVVLLSHQKSTEYIYVDYEPENADYLKGIAGSATYREIIEWIQNKYGVKVRSSEIAQVKDMCGMEKRENYNLGAEGHRVHKVTAERAKLIKEAFKHFRMI